MKSLLLAFFVSSFCYVQNPLSNTIPPPISHAVTEYQKTHNKQKSIVVKFGSESKEITRNIKEYPHEQDTHPLRSFKGKDLAFNSDKTS